MAEIACLESPPILMNSQTTHITLRVPPLVTRAMTFPTSPAKRPRIESPDPLSVKFRSNHSWTLYGYKWPTVFAQPKYLSYPLFIKINIENEDSERYDASCSYFPTYNVKAITRAASDIFIDQLLQILTDWSNSVTGFKEACEALPFGKSFIAINNTEVSFRPQPSFEDQLCTLTTLKHLWGFKCTVSSRATLPLCPKTMDQMPPTISLSSLRIHLYLHDTVVLVNIPGSKDPEALYIFKTNDRAERLYQEIHTLLILPPHPNVLQRPSFLVTKATVRSTMQRHDTTSNQHVVVGFLAPYHSGGQLSRVISAAAESGHVALSIEDQAKWSRQLASALLHVFKYENGTDKSRCGLYTNLKPDNIVLTSPEDGSNVVLIDFEKKINWRGYTPPEISKISSDRGFPVYTRPKSNKPYDGPRTCHQQSFWTYAENDEREAAMVYMLGCCLWCILECQKCIHDLGNHWWASDRFYWRKAMNSVPPQVRDIVERCISRDNKAKPRPTLKEVLEVLEVKWEEQKVLEALELEWKASDKNR